MNRALLAVAAAAALAAPSDARALPVWGPEANLSTTPTDSETGLNHHPMAVDTEGTLHVVWAEQDGPNQNYRIATRRLEAGTWTPAERIVDYLASDPGSSGGAKYPALAALPNGEVHLFWHDYRIDGINNIELFTKVRPAAGAWDPTRSAELRLTTTQHPEVLGDNGYVPVPAVAADGTLHVTWYDFRFDGQFAEIFSKTRPAGGAWDVTPGDSADTRVSTDPDASESPAAATDSAGNLHIAWQSAGSIRYARRDAGAGTWSSPFEASADSAAVSGPPALTVGTDDAVHIVWPDGRQGGKALWTRVRSSAGSWGNELRLTPPTQGADEPCLDTGDDGTIHLVWHDGRVSLFAPQVFHRELPAGGSWDVSGASDSRVSLGAQPAVRPSVLANGGRIFVLWKDARLGNHEIFFRVGGPAGTDAAAAPTPGAGFTAGPNPAPGGRVRFSRPDGRELGALVIWDVRGRVVRRLPAPGPVATWDGLRSDGRAAAAGVYFVRSADLGVRRIAVVR